MSKGPTREHAPIAREVAPTPKPPYVFPGVRPFIESAAEDGGHDLHQVGRSLGLWHVSRIQDALGQIPKMPPESRKQAMEQVDDIRESLALALEGVDSAIAEVMAECEIPAPKKVAKK